MILRAALAACGAQRSRAVCLLVCAAGCSAAQTPPERPRPPEPIVVAAPARYTPGASRAPDEEKGLASICEIDPDACRSSKASRPLSTEIYAVQQIATSGGPDLSSLLAAPASPPAPPPSPVETAPRPGGDGTKNAAEHVLIDVEARVELEVDGVSAALARIHRIVAGAGGQVVNEVVDDKPTSSGAALSLRVPSAKLPGVLSALAATGKLLSRKIEARDVGRESGDAEVLVQNLTATLRRYEELLGRATNTREVLAVEAQLARVRTELDRVRADLRWLRDRAARSTVYVTLSAAQPDRDVQPSASIYPGVRGIAVAEYSGAGGWHGFVGAGPSLLFLRRISLDAAWAAETTEAGAPGLFITTAGGELYSDRLGAGVRQLFNPYLGLRLGYARLLGMGALALGATVGLELYKTEVVLLSLDARAWVFVGPEDGAHGAVEPALSLHFGY